MTSAFGTYKVESIQNLDLSGIETSKKFTTQQKQWAMNYFSNYLIVNCKDGCRILYLDPKKAPILEKNEAYRSPVFKTEHGFHSLRIIPIIPSDFDSQLEKIESVVSQLDTFLFIFTLEGSVSFQIWKLN